MLSSYEMVKSALENGKSNKKVVLENGTSCLGKW